MTATNLYTTASEEDSPNVENAAITIQGGSGVYIKYYNSTITTTNHEFKAIVGKNNIINTTNSNAQIIAAEYTNINANDGTTTLKGGNHNSFISYNSQTNINDEQYTSITVNGGNSTIQSGIFNKLVAYNSAINFYNEDNIGASIYGGTVTMDGGFANNITAYDTNINVVNEISSNIKVTNGSLTINNGWGNKFTTNSDITFNNGYGDTNITVGGRAQILGKDGLNLTLNAYNTTATSLFVASSGNETLNAAGSASGIQVYAWNTNTSSSNLNATTGSGDDLLFAGTGNSTFTGGTGNNTFAFNKENDAGGKTVIADFGKSTGNKIWLANYGFNQNDVSNLLASSHNDSNGNAVLTLNNNHQITIQDISITDLHVSQFNL